MKSNGHGCGIRRQGLDRGQTRLGATVHLSERRPNLPRDAKNLRLRSGVQPSHRAAEAQQETATPSLFGGNCGVKMIDRHPAGVLDLTDTVDCPEESMFSLSKCPQCSQHVTLPKGASPDEHVRCPLCGADALSSGAGETLDRRWCWFAPRCSQILSRHCSAPRAKCPPTRTRWQALAVSYFPPVLFDLLAEPASPPRAH